MVEGAEHLSYTLGQNDHPAVAAGSGDTRGLWGALGTAVVLLRTKWVRKSWRTSWDDQKLRCKAVEISLLATHGVM